MLDFSPTPWGRLSAGQRPSFFLPSLLFDESRSFFFSVKPLGFGGPTTPLTLRDESVPFGRVERPRLFVFRRNRRDLVFFFPLPLHTSARACTVAPFEEVFSLLSRGRTTTCSPFFLGHVEDADPFPLHVMMGPPFSIAATPFSFPPLTAKTFFRALRPHGSFWIWLGGRGPIPRRRCLFCNLSVFFFLGQRVNSTPLKRCRRGRPFPFCKWK